MRFAHIYVEERALGYPLTERILAKLPDAHVIKIRHYKDVFDRKRQDAPSQKDHQALIIAVRDGNRIFKGAPVCQSMGQKNFYYASSMMNCPFDCEYCYLKGMYPSSNMVVFVNLEDYRSDVEEKLKEGPMYVCASYDTDLLAMNPLTGHADYWKELALTHDNLLVELRTKAAVQVTDNIPNIIYAFTVSPDEVVGRFEKNTAPVSARINAAAKAIANGSAQIDFQKLTDVSVGTFRISADYLNKMRRAYPDSETAWYPYVIKDGVAQYEPETDKAMQEYVCALLEKHIGREKIFTWN